MFPKKSEMDRLRTPTGSWVVQSEREKSAAVAGLVRRETQAFLRLVRLRRDVSIASRGKPKRPPS